MESVCKIFKNKTASVIIVVAAILYSLVFVFVGDYDYRDLFFWQMRAPFFSENFMTCGFLFVETAFIKIFGDGVLANRLIAWFTSIICLIIPTFFLRKSESRALQCVYFAMGLLLMGYGTWGQFGPDSLTMLMLTLVGSIWYKYSSCNKWRYVFLLSVFSTFAVLFRFPNILVYLVLGILFLIKVLLPNNDRILIVKQFAFLLLSSFSVLTLCYFALGFNPFCIGEILSENSSGTHTMSGMLHAIYAGSASLIFYLGVFFLFVFLFNYVRGEWMSKPAKSILSVLFAALFGLFYVLGVGFHKHGNYQMCSFEAMMTVGLFLIVCLEELKNHQYCAALGLFGLISVCFVAPMGSDTVWQKLWPILCCPVPFLLSQINWEERLNKYTVPTIIMLFACVISTYVCNPFLNIPLWECREKSESSKFSGIFISKERNDMVSQFQNDYAKYNDGDNTVAIGFLSDMFRYVNSCPLMWNDGFVEDFSSEEYVEKVRSNISKTHPVVFSVRIQLTLTRPS